MLENETWWGAGQGSRSFLSHDFCPPCLALADRAGGDTAAVSSAKKVSALFVARIPGPIPPGFGLWGAYEAGAIWALA